MSEFTVEKGIPVALRRGSRINSLYPWADLEIGDSFFVPGKKVTGFKVPITVTRLGRRFSARTVDGGVRIWRIA